MEIKDSYIDVEGVRTHYLEAGAGPTLVLLHSGEFGGCAELSWERNIPALAEHFHVYAPDWLGYGQTEKLFCFEDMRGRRQRHITAFLRAMSVHEAHFIGNSMGGTVLLGAANETPPPWPMKKIVVVAGGGEVPDNDARKVLNGYDCTRERMRSLVQTMFVRPSVREDEAYIERRYQLSIQPGAWECTAAVRFRAPNRVSQAKAAPDYSHVAVPVLLVTGEKDPLRPPDFGPSLQRRVPGAELCVIPEAGHCPQIEDPDLFNQRAIEFLVDCDG